MVTRATSYGSGVGLLLVLVAFAANKVLLATNVLIATTGEDRSGWIALHLILAVGVPVVYYAFDTDDFSRQSAREVYNYFFGDSPVVEDLESPDEWPPNDAA